MKESDQCPVTSDQLAGRDSVEPTAPKAEDLSVNTLVVLCGCSDGKLRAVAFEGKNAKQVHGYVRHIQGGGLKLKREPLLLVMDTPAIARAIELASAPPPPSDEPAARPSWLGSLFNRKSQIANRKC
jgi:hypothetical protein